MLVSVCLVFFFFQEGKEAQAQGLKAQTLKSNPRP
jgi:hypothetical protein